MGFFFFFGSLLVITLGNLLLLKCLARIRAWSQRRTIQCLVLALPLLTLGVGVSEWCFHSIVVSWMALLPLVPILLFMLIAVSAFLFGCIRLALMPRFLAHYHGQEAPMLQELAQPLRQKLELPPVRMLSCAVSRPLAFTWGFVHPTIFLSSWMIEHLDTRELEAVLAHELQHIAQRDCLIIWLSTILRDAFFYLPTSRRAYRALQGEKELACDDLVVRVTRRPLALASALTKVWLYVLEQGKPALQSGLQSFEGGNISLHTRIERLRHCSASLHNESPANNVPAHTSATGLFLLLQMIGLFVLLAFLGCGTVPLPFHSF